MKKPGIAGLFFKNNQGQTTVSESLRRLSLIPAQSSTSFVYFLPFQLPGLRLLCIMATTMMMSPSIL